MSDLMKQIRNVPDYAYEQRYWVYREHNGQRWFWGAWDDSRMAIKSATKVCGFVLDTREEVANDAE